MPANRKQHRAGAAGLYTPSACASALGTSDTRGEFSLANKEGCATAETRKATRLAEWLV
jgi:hypothetical protein